jgi:hypothetical protein
MQATWVARSAQPSLAARAAPAVSAAGSVRDLAMQGPLSVIARWNSPPAVGEAS